MTQTTRRRLFESLPVHAVFYYLLLYPTTPILTHHKKLTRLFRKGDVFIIFLPVKPVHVYAAAATAGGAAVVVVIDEHT